MSPQSDLATLFVGQVLQSQTAPGVTYRVERPLGEGGMAVALYAIRQAPGGTTPAVLKIVKPEIVGSAGPTALLMVQKEAVALGRLAERVPPTPFVVRLMDTGIVALDAPRIELPWLGLEYVHGGSEGTTLEQRVEYSIRKRSRFAFDTARAAHLVECLGEGLEAIHDVGVVHRDLTPGNVLCCGFGAGEVPKIADFGIARPVGVSATFGGVFLGTPGYAAPEQSFGGDGDIGPSTDVFSFACLVYFALTGEQYFDTANFAHALMLVREPRRRSVLEAPGLCPELRDDPAACAAIDQILAQATSPKAAERPLRARLLAFALRASLRSHAGPRSKRASERLVLGLSASPPVALASGWQWTIRHPPGDERLLRSVAWDADGHCLAVTTEGLRFWDGTTWRAVRDGAFDPDAGLRAVSLMRPGHFLVGGENGLLAMLSSEGAPRVLHGPAEADFVHVSGDPDDLALAVSEQASGPPLLHTVAAARFFRPMALAAARTVSAVARLDDAQWLLSGRTEKGTGFAAVYSPLELEARWLEAPPTDAFTTCAAHVDRGVGLVAGRRGAALRVVRGVPAPEALPGGSDVSCSAIDLQARAWLGSMGRLWTQAADRVAPWTLAWQSPAFQAPFVSLHAEVGVVRAVTVDGAVVEGRAG